MFNDSSNARTSRDCGMSQRTVLSAHSPFLAMEEGISTGYKTHSSAIVSYSGFVLAALKFSSASSRKAFILLWQTKRDIALSALRRIHLGLRKYHKMITIRSIVARTRHFLKLYFPLGCMLTFLYAKGPTDSLIFQLEINGLFAPQNIVLLRIGHICRATGFISKNGICPSLYAQLYLPPLEVYTHPVICNPILYLLAVLLLACLLYNYTTRSLGQTIPLPWMAAPPHILL